MRLIIITAILLVCFLPVQAEDYKYSVGANGGLVTLSGGDFFSYDSEPAFGLSLGHRLANRWWMDIDYSMHFFTNDTTADSSSSINGFSNNSNLKFKATRIGGTISRQLFSSSNWLNLTLGGGGGLMVWRFNDKVADTTFKVTGDKGETRDYAATELFIGGSAGILLKPTSRVSLHLIGRADYFTGAGAEFESVAKEARDNLMLGAVARLSIMFGGVGEKSEWKSDETWTMKPSDGPVRRFSAHDSDNDGVADHKDECLNTPLGAIVNREGCAVDSDGDGVANGLDDCPGTPPGARHIVDIHGCPVDSDFDGVADYEDRCPYNRVGAIVDQTGCPLDADNDGVPDGLDDCPYTLVGMAVDKHGCIDLEMFDKPMVLNIKYASGSFEIDPHSRERIKTLAGLLTFVQDIKMEINGYTDNIGTPVANKTVSEKRANRVRDYLVSLGVDSDRIKTYGRGETNFVASNQTSEGRARNRRIEIVFYK